MCQCTSGDLPNDDDAPFEYNCQARNISASHLTTLFVRLHLAFKQEKGKRKNCRRYIAGLSDRLAAVCVCKQQNQFKHPTRRSHYTFTCYFVHRMSYVCYTISNHSIICIISSLTTAIVNCVFIFTLFHFHILLSMSPFCSELDIVFPVFHSMLLFLFTCFFLD